jgi:uncharacterized membrane protein YgcG
VRVRHDAGVRSPDASADASPDDRPRRPTTPVLALAWLLATVVAGAVAWGAVSLIGGARGPGGDVLSQAQVTAALAEQRAAQPGDPAGGPDAPATAAPEATPLPAATASQPATSTLPASPPATSTPPPAAAPVPVPEPAAPPATGEAGTPGEVARTWDVAGGQVGALCTGAAIRLLYATPLDGWTVEVHDTGPERLEVRFDRSEGRSRVRAQCVGGTPQLDAQSGASGEDGGGSGGGRGSGEDGGGGGSGEDGRGGEDD